MAESRRIAVIPGDGVGPEVVASACRVHEALRPQDELLHLEAGFGTFETTGIALPEESFEAARGCDAILFGAVGSPSGRVDGYLSPILELRRRLGLYANLRPVSSSPIETSRPGIDLLIVRENTEGLYAGRERTEDNGDTAIAERVITRAASRRIAERAVSAALGRAAALGRPARLTIVHKANVLRLSDGLFLNTAGRTPKPEKQWRKCCPTSTTFCQARHPIPSPFSTQPNRQRSSRPHLLGSWVPA